MVIVALMGGNFHEQWLHSRVCRIALKLPLGHNYSSGCARLIGNARPADTTSAVLGSDELKLNSRQLAAGIILARITKEAARALL